MRQQILDGKDLYQRYHPEQPHSELMESVKQLQSGLEKDWVETKARTVQKQQWLQVGPISRPGIFSYFIVICDKSS